LKSFLWKSELNAGFPQNTEFRVETVLSRGSLTQGHKPTADFADRT
jgi:hypothetical protein